MSENVGRPLKIVAPKLSNILVIIITINHHTYKQPSCIPTDPTKELKKYILSCSCMATCMIKLIELDATYQTVMIKLIQLGSY